MGKGPRDTVNDRMRAFGSHTFLKAIGAAVFEAADMVRAEAFRSISAGSVSGKQHQASAPGAAPNRDTGVLQGHLTHTQPAPMVGRVTSDAPYAAALEFGTSRMAARPYMRPARDTVKPKAQRIFNKRVRDALRKERRRSK